MASRRQRLQDRYDHLLPFIEEAAEEYYGGNIDHGFRHWAFATIFGVGDDVQGNDIVQYTAIDGADDFEIDGYYIPESDDDSVVYLFQSKHRQPGTTMGPGELGKFENAPNRILNAGEVAASRNEETKALHERLIGLLKNNPHGTTINLVWATSGTLSAAVRRHVQGNISRTIETDLNASSVSITVTLACWDLESLYEHHKNQQESDDATAICDHVFQLEDGTYHETSVNAEYRTLYMTVPVKQIIDVFARHNFKIFRRNPRGPLGNKVNSAMKLTLLDPIERKRFHLLNNGLTAICGGWTWQGNQLFVRDFQIVNGCQTTFTLWDARAVLRDDPSVLIAVSLTDCPDHFSGRISLSTNRQTPLRAEDFTSNDPVQIRLQQGFSKINPPWFYEIKRGEWSKMLGGPDIKERYRDRHSKHFRKLTSKEVAQAVLSFSGAPGEAKDKIRDFLGKKEVPTYGREGSVSYDKIYTLNVTAEQLLLPAVIQRKVWSQVSADKGQEEWLEYARFHIVWLIGEILRSKYNQREGLFQPEKSLEISELIDQWFKAIYDVAFFTVKDAVQDSADGGQYREFFRAPRNYRAIESKLQGALSFASNFGDPLNSLPA